MSLRFQEIISRNDRINPKFFIENQSRALISKFNVITAKKYVQLFIIFLSILKNI